MSARLHWGPLPEVQRRPLLREPLRGQRRLRVRREQSRLQVQAGIRGEIDRSLRDQQKELMFDRKLI